MIWKVEKYSNTEPSKTRINNTSAIKADVQKKKITKNVIISQFWASRRKARLLCVVPVITVVIVIHAHVNFNRGWLDRVFLNCGWLDRGDELAIKHDFGVSIYVFETF